MANPRFFAILLIPILINCGRKHRENVEEKIYGVITYKGTPVNSAYITNITKKIRVKSDNQGRFSIQSDKGDEIIFESEDKSFFLKVGDEKNLKIELEDNKRKVFYLKNFEPYLIKNDIFVFIPSTEFISPVLSNGMILFTYPKGATRAIISTGEKYSEVNIDYIDDFSIVDINSLNFNELNYANITNSSDKTAIISSYPDFSTSVQPGQSIQIPAGIYRITIGDDEFLENEFVQGEFKIRRGMMKKDIPMLKIEGSARTQTNEPGVLIWAEGTNTIVKSNPNFSIQIPLYSKRIHFSKLSWYPVSVDVQDSGAKIDIELKPISYLVGSIWTNGKTPERIYVDIIREKNSYKYLLKITDFSLIVQQGTNFLMSVSADGYIPKILELNISDYTADIGSIYLCQTQDNACIIEEGIKFLKYGLYRKAREVFSYSQSVSAKSALFMSDIGIIISEDNILSLSEEAKRKSIEQFSEIYDEIEQNINIQISEPICFDEIRFNFPPLIIFAGLSSRLSGCLGQSSFNFFKSFYMLIKFLKKYIYSHKLFENAFNINDLLDPQKVIYLGLKFESDKNLLNLSDDYKSEENLENLKNFFLEIQKISTQDCSSSKEIICVDNDGTIKIMTKTGKISLAKPDFSPFINSISGEYDLTTTDIIQIFPITTTIIPDFIRLNLKRLLSNPLRKFIPAILDKDNVGKIVGIEIEIPTGFKGKNETGFLDNIFVIGESKHFRVSGTYLLDFDEIYPSSSTNYFDDFLTQEAIFYFYFDDPSFGNAIKLSPCKLAINQKIASRYNCPNNEFYSPNNQMLSDVLSAIQKQTNILKILFGGEISNLLNFSRM